MNLKKELSSFDLTSIVVGSIIGTISILIGTAFYFGLSRKMINRSDSVLYLFRPTPIAVCFLIPSLGFKLSGWCHQDSNQVLHFMGKKKVYNGIMHMQIIGYRI